MITATPAGRRNHRVTIQYLVASLDAAGQENLAYGRKRDEWAAVETLGGRELFNARQTLPTATHKLTIPWIDGLTTKQRILFGTRIFEILSIDNRNGDDREMIVVCEEKV